MAGDGRSGAVRFDLPERDMREALLGLVVALVEIVKEALRLQALRRMEAGSLSSDEVERLGTALIELERAIESIKQDLGIADSVQAVRASLDRVVEDALDSLLHPQIASRS